MKSNQIGSGKGEKESGWFLGALLLYPYSYPYFIYIYIYKCSKGKKERNKSYKTMFVRVCTCVRSDHLTLCIKGLPWVAVGGSGSVRIDR